jgi:hypothetical protein
MLLAHFSHYFGYLHRIACMLTDAPTSSSAVIRKGRKVYTKRRAHDTLRVLTAGWQMVSTRVVDKVAFPICASTTCCCGRGELGCRQTGSLDDD